MHLTINSSEASDAFRRHDNDYLHANRYCNDIDKHKRCYGENNDNKRWQLKTNASDDLLPNSDLNRNPLAPDNRIDPDESKLREFVIRANFEKRSCQDTPDALKQSEDLPVADEYRRLRSAVEYDKAKPEAWNWFERAHFRDRDVIGIFKKLEAINETIESLYEFAFECDLAFGTGPEEVLIALDMLERYINVIRQRDKKPYRFKWVQPATDSFEYSAITIILMTPNEIAPNYIDTYDASGKLARFKLASHTMSSFAINL